MRLLIPEEIPEEISNATLGQLVKYFIKYGYSRNTRGPGIGGWESADELYDTNKVKNIIGIPLNTFQKIMQDRSGTSTSHCNEIEKFFLDEIIQCSDEDYKNELHKKWHNHIVACSLRTKEKNTLKLPDKNKHSHLISSWSECIDNPKNQIHAELCKHLQKCENRVIFALTIQPGGFDSIMPLINNTVEENRADVIWAYQTTKTENEEITNRDDPDVLNAVEQQRLSIVPLHNHAIQNAGEELKMRKEKISSLLNYSKNNTLKKQANLDAKMGKYLIFETNVFHYFMGLISLPKIIDEPVTANNISGACDLNDIFGFVQLYTHFPADYADRPALFFNGVDEISLKYASSIIKFFTKWQNLNYLDYQGDNITYRGIKVVPT